MSAARLVVRFRALTVEAVDAGPPDEHALAMLDRARELGAPDPHSLLDAPEASRILGVPLGPPELIYADTLVGIRCAATGRGGRIWAVEAAVEHGDEDGFDARLVWARKRQAAGATPIDGIGDQALLVDDAVYVLVGGHVAIVRVTTPDGAAAGHCVELAGRVAARLA